MLVCKWEKLPQDMKNEDVRRYWAILRKKNFSLFWKRVFDIACSLFMLVCFSPVFLFLAVAIKIDSPGPVFYRQVRVTQYGKQFRIHKFRSMVANADKIGSQVTVAQDKRVTRMGKLIRKCRLDEISQLIDVLAGNMTFVGTRPEVPKYAEKYTDEMKATLLLPAGVTSIASIRYKDEAELMKNAENADETYVGEVLPAKMQYNLKEIERYGFWRDIGTMFKTVFAVFERAPQKQKTPRAEAESAPQGGERIRHGQNGLDH